jgi:hypothetical protein
MEYPDAVRGTQPNRREQLYNVVDREAFVGENGDDRGRGKGCVVQQLNQTCGIDRRVGEPFAVFWSDCVADEIGEIGTLQCPVAREVGNDLVGLLRDPGGGDHDRSTTGELGGLFRGVLRW